MRFLSVPFLCLWATVTLHAQQQEGDSDASAVVAEAPRRVPPLLVPGFAFTPDSEPLQGFGPALVRRSVLLAEIDERNAVKRMLRYDRNRDGFLSRHEIPAQFADEAAEVDRNHDGKLSPRELGLHFANQRLTEHSRSNRQSRDSQFAHQFASQPTPQSVKKVGDLFGGRRSYRAIGGRDLPDGLPRFFIDRDANGDGQITMAEFASKWSDQQIAIFFQSDLNRDGRITSDEALQRLESAQSSQSLNRE